MLALPEGLELTEFTDDLYRVYRKMAWANFDKGGNVVSENPNPDFYGRISDAEKEIVSVIIKNLKTAPFDGNIYLRFNALPEAGRSKNYATGELEDGVSVYEARYNAIKGAYERIAAPLDGGALAYLIQQAPIYFVTGKPVGKGSDGEPVLANVKIVGEAVYDPENDVYELNV